MIIVSKSGKGAINTNYVTTYYISNTSIKAKMTGDGGELASYSTYEMAEYAFKAMLKAIEIGGENRVYYMLQEEEILPTLKKPKERYLNGKKTKGHGGS